MGEAAANSNDTGSVSLSWSSSTNWTIAGGSLVNSITFESSLSATIGEDDQNTDFNSSPKSPLILCPPAPDPSPCEITITFPQKHEVRQVYVRSTARLYEMYYVPDLRSSNEYLCTVRCGIATRDEQVLHTPGFEEAEAVVVREREGSGELDEKRTRSESSSSTNEDGWVEVKASETAQTQKDDSPSRSYSTKPGGSTQDLYEATAEISDADPCISITLRLLSLQNKGCVVVDEIFVFGDPVESDDSESRTSQMENPIGSSVMAMFMPSLLQLSKARSAGRGQDDHTSDNRVKQKSQEIGSNATDLTTVVSKIQEEENSGLADKQKVKLQETVGAAAVPPQLDMPPQVSNTESKPNLSSSHIEKVLDHLVSRVSGIENLFLRFEERMLKPINNIEARLEHVEQQLEELNKKSQNSGMRCCTRISAPEFSCHDFDDFFDNNEINIPELDEKGCPLHIPPEDVASMENQPIAGLSVAAPEFSSVDDEEENDSMEVVIGSSKDSPKHALSVDDALASALAGFLSSTSAEPQKYTQALAIKAPDFSFEEDSSSGKKASGEVKDGIVTGPPIHFIATNETECIKDSESSSSIIFSLESEVEVKSIDDHYSEKTGEGVVDLCQHNEGGKDDAQDGGIYQAGSLTGPEFTRVNSCHIAEDIGSVDINNGVSNTSVLDECEAMNQLLENQTNDGSEEFAKINLYHITEDMGSVDVSKGVSDTSVPDEYEAVNQFLENQTNDGSDNMQEGVMNSECSAAAEVREKESVNVIPQSLLQFPCVSSVVDFEIPILDVKFVSQEISDTKSLLEALLADIPELIDGTPVAENDDGSQVGQQGNLIPVDDWESTSPANGNHFSVDMDYCSLGEMPVNVEDEKLLNCHMSSSRNNNKEYAASLI